MDFLRSFSDFKPRLVLTIKSGWRVAVVVSVNCFTPKFCGAFGRYLTLDSLDLMAWECWDDSDTQLFMLHLFGQNWVSFCRGRFLFSKLERRNEMRLVQSERYLADWLARTCYRMEPASEQDQMQCILEDHFLPGMAISIAAIALCFRAALMKFPEISWADGFQTSLHPSEAGQAHGCGWSETKTSRRSHRCSLEFSLQVKHALQYFFCRFSTFSRSESDRL